MSAKKLIQTATLVLGRVMPGAMLLLLTRQTEANPTGLTVQSGTASAGVNGSRLTVTAGNNAILNWQSFNIAAGETTVFNQPSATSIVWNRINNGANASQIYGTLQANGVVVLLNSAGFYFGPNAFVSAAGLVVSTASCAPPQNAAGGWEFNGPPPLASIVNYGQIKIGAQGSCYLIADQIANHGSIEAPGGSIGLAAGQTVALSERPDGRGLSMKVTLPQGSVDNYGTLLADAGTLSLHAKVVNQDGLLQANSVRDDHGVIELIAGDELNLGADSQIVAAGDASPGGSAGGTITLQSQASFSDAVGSRIKTTGGAQGGDGGNVEISAAVLSLNSIIDARSQLGGTAGQLLLDPENIVLDSSGTGSAGNGTVLAGSHPGTTLDLNVNTAFANLAVSQITLQAADDITVAAGTSWNLSQTIGANVGGVTRGTLTLQAGRDIIFGNSSAILDAHNWSVNLNAGYDFTAGSVQPGVGNIDLSGSGSLPANGSIQLAQGAIRLTAGSGIQTGPLSQLANQGSTIALNAATIAQNGLLQASSLGSQGGLIQLTAASELDFGLSSKTIADGGQVVASAPTINQNGLLQAESSGGSPGLIQLAAGGELAFGASSRTLADGGRISASGTTIDQSGRLQADSQPGLPGWVELAASDTLNLNLGSKTVADGGTVSATATEINQAGLVQANSQQAQAGSIGLTAADQLSLGATSQLLAEGDASASGSAGGQVTLQAANEFRDFVGSRITTTGGTHGGNGGDIEINAPNVNAPNSTIDAGAQAGWQGGVLSLFGVGNLVLGSTDGAVADANGAIRANAAGTSYVNVNSAFQNITAGKILLEASGNISMSDYTSWDLSASTGNQFSGGQLTMLAGGNIVLGSGASIQDAQGWSMTLAAGYSWASRAVLPGVGTISVDSADAFNPSFLQTASGAIHLLAGQSIAIGNGRVTTTAGGAIRALAIAGDINTGTYAQGYLFHNGNSIANAYYVDPSALVGGMSTAAGGNVELIAGGNVTSYLPEGSGLVDSQITAGSGTYGRLTAGDFKVIAGGDVTGHYLVANGAGTVVAGAQMDATGTPEENGAGQYLLNQTGNAGNSLVSPNLALSLVSGSWNVTAANNINLMEVNNPNGDFNTRHGTVNHQFDYGLADQVDLTAGNRIQLGAPASLLPRLDFQVPMIFPGILNLTAGAGGVVLNGDSASTDNQLTLFPSAQGTLNITTTHGGPLVGGSFTSEDPNSLVEGYSSIFNLIVSNSGYHQYNPNVQGIFGLSDDAATPVHWNSEVPVALNIAGNMDYVFLAVPEVAHLTIGGNMDNSRFRGVNLTPGLDIPHSTSITVTGDINNDAAVSDSYGYQIGGGGYFSISAHNLNLGTSDGTDSIKSVGVGLYNNGGDYPLASRFTTGADILLTLTGDLTMDATSIASLAGGNISIRDYGNVEVGAAGVPVTALGARGIYTTGQGNLTVIANGNINVAGSRLAAYDGGNVTVESLYGNVDAGQGGTGFVTVYAYQVDPNTRAVSVPAPTIPGSGILTTTFPTDYGQAVGNILVETPRGSINASAGGIVQLPLNTGAESVGPPPAPGSVVVLAGYELQDGSSQPVMAANLAQGSPVQVAAGGNINATGSGVIGGNVLLKATGDIQGAIFARDNLTLTAQQNINVTALAEGSLSVSSGGTVSGTLIGVGGVSASGSSIDASLESNNGITGDTSGSKGMAQGNAANATSAAASASEGASGAAAKTEVSNGDDLLKKKKPISLARKISRVTVLLPEKH